MELRDYYDEIMASVNICAQDWKVSNLCVWNDLVVKNDPNAGGSGGNSCDRSVEDLEAEAEAAEFAMVKSKLAIFGFVYIIRLCNLMFPCI